MNTILLQICEKFIGEVAGFFGEGKSRNFEEMENSLKKTADGFILEMMKTYFEILDQSIVEDKAGRKRKGLVIERKKDKREIYTKFGGLKFERTYFQDKRHQEYVYLLDQVVGLEGHERISGNVAVDLVEHASEASYWKSSKNVSRGEISPQTVMNKVRLVKDLKINLPESKRKVKVLHVEADEDHVALQDGTNTIVPLISIHEGIERNGKRGLCKNIRHISDYGKSTEQLWLEAVNWIYEAYEVDDIERIYLHGDGAAWIKEGLNWLPKSKMVLDRYHLNRAIITATGSQPEYRKDIYSALSEGNQEEFKTTIRQLQFNAMVPSERKRIDEFKRYVLNNWGAISIYGEEACAGSCTEGHISHILSSRLSSRPMGWSKKGLKAMAKLRAYCGSGGQIELKHIKKTEACYRVTRKVLEKAAESYKRIAMENQDNVTMLARGKVVPFFKNLRVLQRGYVQF
ncbi:MAG: ISLre2 family transposase [Thermincolia bacterium]